VTAHRRIEVDRRDDTACIAIAGEIDLANRDELLDQIITATTGVRRAVLNLEHVEYIDSAGVRLLFDAARELARRGVDLAIVRPRAPYIARILALAAVDQTVPVFATSDEALVDH
jgi:anti-anti-sigma factor